MKLYTVSRIYIILALLAAAVFSPLAYSFAPVILLAWYLFQTRWPISAGVSLTTAYFLYFAVEARVQSQSFKDLVAVTKIVH